MYTYTVSFFGHRKISNVPEVERCLEQLVQKLLREREYVQFLVGREGEFDQIVASTVCRCKRNYRSDNSALVWVLPYHTAELRNNEASFRDYYDEIEVCSFDTYFKSAHRIRNRSMVNRSDLVVFCVQRESGGAWQTMKYAKNQGIPHINISMKAAE